MMGTFITVLLLGCIYVEILANDSVYEYLDKELKQSKEEIAKKYIRQVEPVSRKTYKVDWLELWKKRLDKEKPFIANVSDTILILEGSRTWLMSSNVFPSYEISLKEIKFDRVDDKIKFVRSIDWKGVVYLLICNETGSCNLYTGTDAFKLRHRQTLENLGLPMDAKFFSRANRLYLAIAYNSGLFTVPSIIYHWKGTYMDVIEEIMTIGAVSVATFKHKQSTIIVFAQNDKLNPKLGTVVYEFKETGTDMIQFLPSFSPISVDHCNHGDYDFIFLLSSFGTSNLFWWDGTEFLNWLQIAEIQEFSLFRVVNFARDTFFMLEHDNVLHLYKFESPSECVLLDSRKLMEVQHVLDIQLRIVGSNMILDLVTLDQSNVYSLEQWKLNLNEIPHLDSTMDDELASKCILELIEILAKRNSILEKARASWPSLLSSTENSTISNPLILSNVILESGTVRSIDFLAEGEIIAPRKMKENLEKVARDIDDVFAASRKLPALDESHITSGDILVEGNAFFEELEINSMDVDFLNDLDVRSKGALQLKDTRGFDSQRNLVVDSLCGIPPEFWVLKNDSTRLVLDSPNIEFDVPSNTVILHSNISLPGLNVKLLNDVDVNEFFAELFIIDRNQEIEGNLTYMKEFEVTDLTIENLNGEPMENFMTRTTNQSIDDFSIKTLEIDKLDAEFINGVPVSGAARISKENVIKGPVRVSSLHVTKKFTVDPQSNAGNNLVYPTLQIYDNVTIRGNVKAKKIDVKASASMFLNGEELNLNEILNDLWTKSTNQTIKNKIAFEGDLIIDRLDATYLNGFLENEFLYTSAKEIPENFRNLHLQSVRIDDLFLVDGEDTNLYAVAPESLTVREKIRLKDLRVNELFVDTFNGVPVESILNLTKPLVFPENAEFSTLRANRIDVDDLDLLFLNGEPVSKHVKSAQVVQNHEMVSPKSAEFHVESLIVEKINGIEMKRFESLRDTKNYGLKNLLIDGDLTVKNNLLVERVDETPIKVYFENLSEKDIRLKRDESIEELTIENLTLNLLHGHGVTDLFQNILSISREQEVPGRFSFYRITTDNVQIKFINNWDTSKLMWIDEPIMLAGNVTFTDLAVDGDVVTGSLNGHNVNELYESLLDVPIKEIKNLKVDGSISWSSNSSNTSSLSFLFENAVTKNSDQTITGDTKFENSVFVSTMTGKLKEFDEIRSIVNDTVIDDKEISIIAGKKLFKENLSIENLIVTGDVEIPKINDIDILEFNQTVIRKYQNATITNPVTFLEEVKINEIFVDDDQHGSPLNGLALVNATLPKNVIFKHLTVQEKVTLLNLDGINLTKFVEERITLNGEHEIPFEVQFDEHVEAAEIKVTGKINGVRTSTMVFSGIEETQFISGAKIFEEDLVLNGSIHTPLVNNVDVKAEYSNGIQNDEDVEIFGDLIFESPVNIKNNISVTGLINNANLPNVLDNQKSRTLKLFQTLKQHESLTEEIISRTRQISLNLKKIFMYLETEEKLRIQVPNIHNVDVVYFESTTRLNIFGEEPGQFCGLPNDCPCPLAYVADLTKEDCNIWKRNGNTRVQNFHGSNGAFGINVATNTLSSSQKCTSNSTQDEYTTISWMKPGLIETGDLIVVAEEPANKIQGFLKDTQVFVHNNDAFVVLAIYYDQLHATHSTDSLMYKIDFEKNELSLHQRIPTNGAWAAKIFKINSYHGGTYLLVGCFGDSSESFLYKLDSSSKLVLLRTFSGKSRFVKNLSQENHDFVLLEGYDTNAVNIFNYVSEHDNFYSYQSLFHDSRVTGIECFHADDYNESDSFVIVTTEDGLFYIYEFMFAQKFRVKVQHWIENMQTMIPFHYAGHRYIFTGASTNSTILRIVQPGPY